MIAPAPRKPMPVTICAAMRVGSARTTLWPDVRNAWNPYADTIVKSAEPSATSRCVRKPASRSRSSRSTPMSPPRNAASASRRSASLQWSVGMLCANSTRCLLLRGCDLFDACGGELEQLVESCAREGRPLRSRLHLDELAVAGHDDVHVDFGLRVLRVVEVEQRLTVHDADGDRCDGSRERARQAEAVERAPSRHVRTRDRGAARAAVRLQHVAVDPQRALAERLEIRHPADGASD